MFNLLKRGLAALMFICVPTMALAATITAADVGTSTATGQGSVVIVSGTPTAGSSVQQSTGGSVAAMSVVVTGTFSGTLNFEVSADGATFAPVSCALVGSATPVSAATGDGTFSCPVGQASTLRVRASALSSGTPGVVINIYYHDVGGVGATATTTIADGGAATLGAKADAKSAATDTTPISVVSALKEISDRIQALAAALPASSNIIGKVGVDQTTPGTTNGVQINAALPAGTNVIGKTSIDQTTPGTTNGVVSTPVTSGGLSPFSANVTTAGSGAGTGGVVVDANPGQLYGYAVWNGNSSVCYFQLFDQTQALTNLGTTVPKLSIGIPALGGANVMLPIGVPFATAITVGVTTTRAGSTACSTGLDLNFLYK